MEYKTSGTCAVSINYDIIDGKVRNVKFNGGCIGNHLGISALVAIVFYYVINKPRFGNIWAWLVVCILNAIINFLMGYYWTVSDLYEGLMVATNPKTGIQEQLPIEQSDCLCFGVSNAILSLGVFFLISIIIKNGSNSKNAPFSFSKYI